MNSSEMNSSNPDKHLNKSRKRKNHKWLEGLRKPEIFRLIKLGVLTFKLLKWLIELLY